MKKYKFDIGNKTYEIKPRKFEQNEVFLCRVEYITRKIQKYENIDDELYHDLVIKSYKVANEKVLGCRY